MTETLTDECLLFEAPHPLSETADMTGDEKWRGLQRFYRLPNGYGLSLVNPPALHSYRYAWEAAVLSPGNDSDGFGSLNYTTPLTSDVEVFMTVADTNAFIIRAVAWAKGELQ